MINSVTLNIIRNITGSFSRQIMKNIFRLVQVKEDSDKIERIVNTSLILENKGRLKSKFLVTTKQINTAQ